MDPTSMKQSVPSGKVNVKHPILGGLFLLLRTDPEETGWGIKLE